jgi:hypothetical protein
MFQPRVLIVCDNFRVGGLERLALDQLFGLSDMKIPAIACYRQFNATRDNPNFLDLEFKRISKKNLIIQSLPEADLAQLKYFIRLIKTNNFSIVINHSIGASVLLRIAKIITRKKLIIKTFIHQLPTLSAPIQRFKRFLFILTSDEIYAYSEAVVCDWNQRLNSNFLFRIFLGWKRPQVLRNGIYLDRLPKIKSGGLNSKKQIRLIFIGRGVAWKNKNFIIEKLRKNPNLTALLVLPVIPTNEYETLIDEFGKRIQFKIGKKIEDIEFSSNDINIYPVNYGLEAKYIESVSLNCLEMSCLGIPSLITRAGSKTWPELLQEKFVLEVDWKSDKDFNLALSKASTSKLSLKKISQIRSLISIRQNLENILIDN